MDAPPHKIREAALIAIRTRIINDKIGRSVRSLADGAGGTTRYSFAGPGRPTGIDDVDVVLNSYPKVVFA
jgi:hypothetical protein